MKKYLMFLILLIIPFTVQAEQIDVNMFYMEGCPHCAALDEYLEELDQNYDLNIIKYEVSKNKKNSDLLTKVRKKFKNNENGVPYLVVGEKDLTGFGDTSKKLVNKMLDNYNGENYVDKIKNNKNLNIKEKENNKIKEVPLLGEINAKDISLPLVAIVIGLVDGFNPCAMWVLLFLITMLLGMKNKKRMWALGITFLLASAIIYVLFMLAWLNIAISAFSQTIFRTLIALFAIIFAIINIKNYFKSKETGCEIVDNSKRKKIINKIKKFTTQKSLFLAIIGVMTLAVTVNVVELACSAGLPLLFTSILALNDLNIFEYAINILIYIIFFLLDDIIVFIIAMKTLEVTGITTKYTKYSHLIGGIIMLIIGFLLLFKPAWLMLNF